MESANSNNPFSIPCPQHQEQEVKYYCPIKGCAQGLLCSACLRTHYHPPNGKDNSVKDITVLFSDENLVKFHQKFDQIESNSQHKKAVEEFLQSFFDKLQAEIIKMIESTKETVLNAIKAKEDGSNFPIDAVKMELESLRDSLDNSHPAEKYKRMEEYVQKYMDIDSKVTAALALRVDVPVIDEEDYEKFLIKIRQETNSIVTSLLKPQKPAQVLEKKESLSAEKIEELQAKIPGLSLFFDRLEVNWIGKHNCSEQAGSQNSSNTFPECDAPEDHLWKILSVLKTVWGAKGSRIQDSDVENFFVPPILTMKSLVRVKLNFTKTLITNKSLETLKKLEAMATLKKLWISFYDSNRTSMTQAEVQEFAKYINKKMINTKVVIRDVGGYVVEY